MNWHYLTIKGGKICRLNTVNKEARLIAKTLKDPNCIVFTDTINPICIRTANNISKWNDIPVIGVCTDSPSNISGTSRAYTMYLLKQSAKCYGYIALTNDLNDLYNPNDRKSLIIEGVVEEPIKDANLMGEKNPYIFFGGALLERYGVYNLIEAFKLLKDKDLELYICGHSGSFEKIHEAIKGYKNIHFLGTLPVKCVLQYEMYALANVNPRPFNMDLDKLSIPSKTLEYLASGAPTISVKNTKLQKTFENEAIWAKSGSVEDLHLALTRVLDLTKKERKELGQRAKEKVLAHYSLESINKQISGFLKFFEETIN